MMNQDYKNRRHHIMLSIGFKILYGRCSKVSRIFFLVSLMSACSFGNSSFEMEHGDDSGIEFSSEASDARYTFLKAEILLKQEKFDDALRMFEKADKKSEKTSPTILKRLTQLYIRAGKLEEALKTCDRLIKIDPNSIDALQLKAGTLGAMSKTEESIEIYRLILKKIEPPHEETYLLLSGLLIQNGRTNEALSILRELIAKKPDSFVGSYYLAKIYVSMRQFNDALDYYEKALALNPSAEQVEMELIQVLALDRKISKAIERAESFVYRNPSNLKAKELLAELLLGDQQVEKALKTYEKARKLEKAPGEIQFKVALLKLQKRDYDGSASDFNLILSNNPNHHEARYYLGTAYASQGRILDAVSQLELIPPGEPLYIKARGFGAFLLRQENNFEDALSLIHQALKIHPDNIELLSYQTSIERESGDIKAAIKTLRRISSLEPKNEQHLFNLAVALDDSGERDEALEMMEEIITLNPLNANALNYLGYSLAEKGLDLDRAEELIKKAISIELNNGYFIDSLGWVYYQRGKYSEALLQLEKANELVPSDPVILEHLGKTYLKLNRKNEAKTTLQKSYDKLEGDSSQESLRLEIKELMETIK